MNVGKSKVMRCSRYVNVGKMYARLNDKPLYKMGCFKYQEPQVTADGGCERDVVHRMNEMI